MELQECYNKLIKHNVKDIYMLTVALLNQHYDDEKINEILDNLKDEIENVK